MTFLKQLVINCEIYMYVYADNHTLAGTRTGQVPGQGAGIEWRWLSPDIIILWALAMDCND